MNAAELFAGPASVRVPGERRSLWLCVIAAPLVIALARIVFPAVSVSEFVLVIAGGLAFVSIARGRLLGSSIRIDGRQFPEIDALTADLAGRLGIVAPQVFVRDDPFVPIVAVGVAEPYALVISSQCYEHLHRDELGFLIARELGHIAAGHTRLTSLLSASGRENPIVSLVFGAWLRKTEFTADRVGLLLCGDLDDALGAIAITTFHTIGRRVDLQVLAEQRSDLESEPALRLGEWIASAPYATNRLEALRRFAAEPLTASLRGRLAIAATRSQPSLPVPATHVARAECASVPRRFAAAAIDLAVVAAALRVPLVAKVEQAPKGKDDTAIAHWALAHLPLISIGAYTVESIVIFFVYSAVLVALAGQTLGMTVLDLRVVRTDRGRPLIVQTFWRYAVAFGMSLTGFAMVGFFMRINPHDRLSRTRLVGGRRST